MANTRNVQNQEEDPNVIKAFPTKELFITMLIRDITLKDAIGDLVDNSVDGARAVSKRRKTYNGLSVDIALNGNSFKIQDNCGGFSVDIARKYAFRFGRPSDFHFVKGSIGQFGIGMKRAIFKIGGKIEIESKTISSYFKMSIDVEKWRSEKEDWNFQFDEFEENETYPANECGTTIKITALTSEAKRQFSDPKFVIGLIEEIAKENMYNLNKGLQITINGTELEGEELELISTDEIKPAYWENTFGNVKVELYAGIGQYDLKKGGWYIFCNDRLILGPEQTYITGWTGKGKDGVAVYHDQFSAFRGYVFFYADNSSDLPWNTTKTSVDIDSPLYNNVRVKMIEMMKQVITFLNKAKQEREEDNPVENRYLNNLIELAEERPLTSINEASVEKVFTYPNISIRKAPSDARISYSKPKRQIDAAKEFFSVSSNKEVGEKTFEYFYENEIE